MVCTAKVGTVVKLEDARYIYLSITCGARKIAEFYISEEEYLALGGPKPGDAVDYGVTTTTYNDGTSKRVLEIRFLGRPVYG
jgi:hypothetical protein